MRLAKVVARWVRREGGRVSPVYVCMRFESWCNQQCLVYLNIPPRHPPLSVLKHTCAGRLISLNNRVESIEVKLAALSACCGATIY